MWIKQKSFTPKTVRPWWPPQTNNQESCWNGTSFIWTLWPFDLHTSHPLVWWMWDFSGPCERMGHHWCLYCNSTQQRSVCLSSAEHEDCRPGQPGQKQELDLPPSVTTVPVWLKQSSPFIILCPNCKGPQISYLLIKKYLSSTQHERLFVQKCVSIEIIFITSILILQTYIKDSDNGLEWALSSSAHTIICIFSVGLCIEVDTFLLIIRPAFNWHLYCM